MAWKEEIRTFEWLVYIFIAVLSILSLILVLTVTIPPREAFLNDASLWRTPEDNTVPMWLLVLYMALLSFLLAGLEYYVCRQGPQPEGKLYAALRAWLGYVAMNLLASSLIGFLKIYVAEPRPDFMSRCYGEAAVPPPSYTTLMVSTIKTCPSGDHATLNDGRMAWPSGHSASAAASSLFFVAYALWRTRKLSHLVVQLAWCTAIIPLVLGFFIGATRIVNNKHSPADVASGFLIGIVCAVFYLVPLLYSMEKKYYPKNPHPEPHHPYHNADTVDE